MSTEEGSAYDALNVNQIELVNQYEPLSLRLGQHPATASNPRRKKKQGEGRT
jgi:hypothetical protein